MSSIVLGIGASHTTLMNTQWARVDHLPRAHAFRDALGGARALLQAARPDAVVIVGSNHFRGLGLDLMPPLTIGVGEILAEGEHGTPKGLLPGDPALALSLCQAMLDEDVDCAFSARLPVDHGISHAYQWLMPDPSIPIVPVVVNCFAPPLPSLRRAVRIGEVLRKAAMFVPGDRRIAIIATGGLSHALPFPDWRAPDGDDEEFLAGSFLEGRGDWERFETRRRAIVVGAPPRLNPAFDRDLLARLTAGALGHLPDVLADADLVRIAGNGANEVRAWLIMAAALANRPGRTLAYSEMPEWLTGMAVAVIEPEPANGEC